MLKCTHLVDKADLLIDDADLSLGQRFSLRVHLVICRHCRRYVRQLRVLTAHLRHRDPPPADDDEVDAILRRIDNK